MGVALYGTEATYQPIPYGQAVETGKTAAQKLHEAPELKQHGGVRISGQGDIITLPSKRGTKAKYLAALGGPGDARGANTQRDTPSG